MGASESVQQHPPASFAAIEAVVNVFRIIRHSLTLSLLLALSIVPHPTLRLVATSCI